MKLVLPALAITLGAELIAGSRMLVRARPSSAAAVTVEDAQYLPVAREWYPAPAAPELPPAAPAACLPQPGQACLSGRIDVSPAALREWRRRQERGPEDPLPPGSVSLQIDRIDVGRVAGESAEGATQGRGEHPPGAPSDQESVELEVSPEGRFESQLPPGTYQLTAASRDGELVAWMDDLKLEADSSREQDVTLGPAASISAVVRTAGGAPVSGVAFVEVSGARRSISATFGQDGKLRVNALPVGQYDLTVKSQLRTRVLHAVSAPANLTIEVERPAVVRGRIAGRTLCDSDSSLVNLTSGEGIVEILGLSADCSFSGSVSLPPGEVKLSVTLEGRALVHSLYLPEHGDPPPVCLGGSGCPPPPPGLLVATTLRGTPVGAFVMLRSSSDDWAGVEHTSPLGPVLMDVRATGWLDVVATASHEGPHGHTRVWAGDGITEVTVALHPGTPGELAATVEEIQSAMRH